MGWITFSYSVQHKISSNPRVKSWRRLRRLGAITPFTGIHILPNKSECVEAFQWLAQEMRHEGGRAVVIPVEQFDGISDKELVECFRQERTADYQELEQEVIALEAELSSKADSKNTSAAKERLRALKRQFNEIGRIDYFKTEIGENLSKRLIKLSQSLSEYGENEPEIKPASINDYRESRWITRPQPHVDRLASIWLIRRFINADAKIRFASRPRSGEVSFDMEGADFGHVGSLCTFETMMRAFDLKKPGLQTLAEVIHEVDLRDERYFHPEISGVDAILNGWRELDLSDTQLEERGIALFDSLLRHFSTREEQPPSTQKKAKA